MTAADVVHVLRCLDREGVTVHVDGDWAVDALVGEQTRQHDDLDIAVPHDHVPRLRRALAELGFADTARQDSSEHNFVLADAAGRRVDVHSYVLDGSGNNIAGIGYVADHLAGTGVIGGHAVPCVRAEALVRFHTGYEPDAEDRQDVRLLCERFGIPLPESYRC